MNQIGFQINEFDENVRLLVPCSDGSNWELNTPNKICNACNGVNIEYFQIARVR
jgi:hypothetical protein